MDINVLPRAQRDIDSAVKYYLSISVPLSLRFSHRLQSAITEIQASPLIGSMQFNNLRRDLRVWPVQVFPYRLFYIPLPAQIDLLRVLHERRRLSRQTFRM